tara:strand:- start:4808 stop:6232 length:1425 start_codon:yes stop_codon:yes gene_type:complete
MANPYSQYTGTRISAVPTGYLTAAAKQAEGVQKSGERMGDLIGAGIAKYYEGKAESEQSDLLNKFTSTPEPDAAFESEDFDANINKYIPVEEQQDIFMDTYVDPSPRGYVPGKGWVTGTASDEEYADATELARTLSDKKMFDIAKSRWAEGIGEERASKAGKDIPIDWIDKLGTFSREHGDEIKPGTLQSMLKYATEMNAEQRARREEEAAKDKAKGDKGYQGALQKKVEKETEVLGQPKPGTSTSQQKNIITLNDWRAKAKADGTWTQAAENLMRKDLSLSTTTEVKLDDLALQLKQQEVDAEEGEFETDGVVYNLTNEAGDKLPIGIIKTSKGGGQVVSMSPGVGTNKKDYSMDAQRLRQMYEQYSGYFSYIDEFDGVVKIPVESMTDHQRQAIDGVAMLILGMQRNMGLPLGEMKSVVNGQLLKPADPAPEDREKVEDNQRSREKTEDEEQKDAMDKLNNRGAPNPNAHRR